MKTTSEEKHNNISSSAVKAKTGKDWKAWFKLLDKEKANKLLNKEIATLLYEKHKLSGWWAQMVAVGYEQAKGLRVQNQKHDGDFSVDISKVIDAPLKELYGWIADDTKRKKWLKGKIEVRKANTDKSIRANFNGGTANLTFMFYAKPANKAQVVITESKLEGAKQVEESRTFWKEAINKLEKQLIS